VCELANSYVCSNPIDLMMSSPKAILARQQVPNNITVKGIRNLRRILTIYRKEKKIF